MVAHSLVFADRIPGVYFDLLLILCISWKSTFYLEAWGGAAFLGVQLSAVSHVLTLVALMKVLDPIIPLRLQNGANLTLLFNWNTSAGT